MNTTRSQSVHRVQNLRRSNAATAIPSRKIRRQGSRASRRAAAIKEN